MRATAARGTSWHLRSGALRGMWRWGARGRSGLRWIRRDGRRRIGWGKN